MIGEKVEKAVAFFLCTFRIIEELLETRLFLGMGFRVNGRRGVGGSGIVGIDVFGGFGHEGTNEVGGVSSGRDIDREITVLVVDGADVNVVGAHISKKEQAKGGEFKNKRLE